MEAWFSSWQWESVLLPLQAVVLATLELPAAFSCGSATNWLPLNWAIFSALEEKEKNPSKAQGKKKKKK